MQKTLYLIPLFALSLSTGIASAQTGPKAESLCTLQQNVTEGHRRPVTVSGIFSEGLERGTLEDNTCPKEATWAELDLQPEHNKEKLRAGWPTLSVFKGSGF